MKIQIPFAKGAKRMCVGLWVACAHSCCQCTDTF